MKKNQIMITTLAIMLAVAGYLNMAERTIGEETLVVTDGILTDDGNITALLDISEEDILSDIESLDDDGTVVLDSSTQNSVASGQIIGEEISIVSNIEEGEDVATEDFSGDETPGEAVFTSTQAISSLSAAKLLKEQTRAKNKEALLEIINSVNITELQKQVAVDTMIQMTDYAEKEMASEILLESKGFQSAVVSIDEGSVDVVVYATSLTDAQLAQIEDIVVRKTNISAENIVISQVTSLE
ncbi:MAG: SpoIIIAH-like family protein [Lachnospiraceae bacterium]